MLNHEDTLELIRRANAEDEEAKTILIEQNSPLIKSVIKRYKNKGIEYEDLYQLGCIGFLKAIKNFSEKFNVKFSTYAVPMIEGEVKRFLRDDGYIKVSRAIRSQAISINYFIERYKHENNKSPTIDIIAKEFSMDPQEVVFAMDSSNAPISIYEKTEDEGSLILLDKIASKEDDIFDNLIIKDFIEKLNERERKIIILRYYRDKTQSEVAKVMKVSQVQISRIENKILDKMRQILSQ